MIKHAQRAWRRPAREPGRWTKGRPRCAWRDDTFRVFQRPPLFRYAPFPSGFRLQVNRMTQEQPSELLLTESGIQHRVPRRTLSTHAAQALKNAPARYDRAQLRWPTTPLTGRGCPIGLGVNLDGTATGPATEIGGDRTSEDRTIPPTDLLCPPHRLAVGSRPSTPEGSQPAFAWGNVPTPIRTITGRPSLPPSSFTRRPIGPPSAGLPLREDDGLTTLPHGNLHGLGPALTPVARHLRRVSCNHPDLATYHFGPSLSAPLACH